MTFSEDLEDYIETSFQCGGNVLASPIGQMRSEWHTYTAVVPGKTQGDQGKVRLYYDDALLMAYEVSLPDSLSCNLCYIARKDGNVFYNGEMGSLILYGAALNAVEITDLASHLANPVVVLRFDTAQGVMQDYSGNGHDATIQRSPTVGTRSNGAPALVFNASAKQSLELGHAEAFESS